LYDQPQLACVFAQIGQNESILLAEVLVEFIERNSPKRLLKKSVVFCAASRILSMGAFVKVNDAVIGPTAGEPVLVCRS
jgi:hypothetical protein